MQRKHRLLSFFAVACLTLTTFWPGTLAAYGLHSKTPIKYQSTPNQSAGQSRTAFREREIIVKFKEGTDEGLIKTLNKRLGMTVLAKQGRRHMQRLRTPGNTALPTLLAAYRANAHVAYAEPNYTVTSMMVPNDTYYSLQWHLDNEAKTGLNCKDAWDVETGAPEVIVAVLDTGVAYEDYGRYRLADDLSNTAFVQGYDFINNDAHPNDDNGHGTHVTGSIAQSTNNGIGVAGVAFNVSIMPVKVLDSNGSGTHSALAEGIYYAVDNGAKLINMSMGSNQTSNTLEEAIKYAYDNGVTIIAAAGNDGESTLCYPAAYDDYVIAVGATRYDGTRAYYSNYGASLDIMAPGGDLTVDQNDDGYPDGILQQTFSGQPSNFAYWFYEGTSMATPQVTGVAALVLSRYNYVPDQVREAIEITAREVGESGSASADPGLVDAEAALGYVAGDIHEVRISDISVDDSAIVGDTFNIGVIVKNAGSYDETVSVTLINTTSNQEIGILSVPIASGDTAQLDFSWATEGLGAGIYAFTALVSGVSEEINTSNNEKTLSVKLVEPSHGLAITAFDVPLEAQQGEILTLPVTVENTGTYVETAIVTVSQSSGELAQEAVTLAAGEAATIQVQWDTVSATLGEHTLTAIVSAVDGETDTSDNAISQTITITDQGSNSTDVEIFSTQTESLGGHHTAISAYVRNKGDSAQSITLSCSVASSDGMDISDPGLLDISGTLPSHTSGYATWNVRTPFSAGVYTATIRIAGTDAEATVSFQVR